MYNYFGTKSILHDLPVCKADNDYTVYIDGEAYPKPGWDGRLRDSDNFGFPFFRIETTHMQKINGLLLDHAFHGTKIIYNRRERFLDLVMWFLSEPCKVGKNLEGANADRQLRHIFGLAELMRSLGWDGEVVWKQWPNPKIPSMEAFRTESAAMNLAFQRFLNGERDTLPEELMLDLQTPYSLFPDAGLKGESKQEDNDHHDVVTEEDDSQQEINTERYAQATLKQELQMEKEQVKLQDKAQAGDQQPGYEQGHVQQQESVQQHVHIQQDDEKRDFIREDEIKPQDTIEQHDYGENSVAEKEIHVQQEPVNYEDTDQKHNVQQDDAVLLDNHFQRLHKSLLDEVQLKASTSPQPDSKPKGKPYSEEITDSRLVPILKDAVKRIMFALLYILLILVTICIAAVDVSIKALAKLSSGLNYTKNGIRGVKANLYRDLMQAKVLAQHARSAQTIVEDHDNPEVKNPSNSTREPSQDGLHNLSSRESLQPNDVPPEPKERSFKNSAQKMEPKRALHYANLRSNKAFPDLRSLPRAGSVDPDYFATEGFTYGPRRNWCFLAEIVDVKDIARPRLVVRDKTGRRIPIAFHTDNRGNELAPSLIQKGNTIAVLYAELYRFIDSFIVIHHEGPEMLKIFPMGLEELLGLSDRVQKYAAVEKDEGICHGCDRKASSLRRCTKCILFSYCDKTCQLTGWKDKGHKSECKILRDWDIQGMLRLDWDTFEEHLLRFRCWSMTIRMLSSTSTSTAYKHFHSPENASFYNNKNYKHLNHANREIRLLQIQRNHQSSLLSFKLLQPVPLAEAGCFIAVSYRAGNPRQTVPVLINGQRFNVFAPLGGALARVAQRLDVDDQDDRDLTLAANIWADQICIDQSNAVEKGHQVQLMRHIYAESIVFAWLGSDPLLSAGLREMLWLNDVQARVEATLDKPWTDVMRNDLDTQREYAKMLLEKLYSKGFDWDAVGALLRDPYWSRAWIAQELLVARAMTVNTDVQEMDREAFARAMHSAKAVAMLLVGYFQPASHGGVDGQQQQLTLKDDPIVPTKGLETLVPVCRGLSWLRELRTDFHDFFLDDRDKWEAEQGLDVQTLMLHARQCQATDPLDNVYAFLGLASDGYSDVVPDYGPDNTLENTYTQIAKAAISKEDFGLNLLSFAEERSPEMLQGRDRLPSWVPDWNPGQKTRSLRYRVQGDPRAPHASGKLTCSPRFHPDAEGRPDRIMECLGVIIDRVAESPACIGDTVGSYRSWEECVVSWAACAGLDLSERLKWEGNRGDYVHQAGDSRMVAFWSTICRGIHTPERMRMMGNLESELGEVDTAGEVGGQEDDVALGPGSKSPNGQPSPALLGPLNAVFSKLPDTNYLTQAGFRFFCSPAGYYGLARSRVAPGDVICVLVGASVPFILRPCEGGDLYQLMGEAYVHGVMYGEVMGELEAEGIRREFDVLRIC
ncbi:hypothetical protein PT974_10586 [Cladobotryum mycophilum]|uniref:MYND-type domain-containing protein n=1 Tax=Cladobotryum mycophilum TaxID=491253 RepID=A0ABR0SAA1_9HYPO